MKKFTLVGLLLCTATALFAQDQTLRTKMAVKTRLGVRAGISVANFQTESNFIGRTDARSSLATGVYLNIPFGSSGFAFQPEFGYSKQGAKINVRTSSVGAYSFNQHLDYVTVPLVFQYKIPKGFFLELGPQAGFLVDARTKESTKPTFRPNQRNKGWYDKFDLAAAYGVGYMSRVGLGVNARYTMGLSDAISDDAPTFITGKARNGVWQFTLTYNIGASK